MAPTVRTQRTQEERSRETIDRLRAAVLSVIAERGYVGCSTTEVARRAGVSRGALLHHFPRKVDLIADAAAHFWGEASAHLRRIGDALDGEKTDVAAFVEDMWTTVFRQEAARMTIDLVSASLVDAELRGRIEPLLDDLFEEYDRVATEAFAAAGLETRQRLALVHVATCALRGLRMQEMMQGNRQNILAARAALVILLETYLRADHEGGQA
ncbi:MAG: TetR/AcrR family transcriptional regulator [Pseudomonadota bacterium]